MNEKVILILVDGMTPASLNSTKHPFIDKLVTTSISNLSATTVMPSVTLPLHI
jgi:predicted AlkP superfamily pyrophosphatase or phosphodiesterase